MKKLIEELEKITEEKYAIIKKELDILSAIKRKNCLKMHSYHELPDTEEFEEKFLEGLDSPVHGFGHSTNRSLILSIELPDHHINIITPYNISMYTDHYLLKCDKDENGWLGMWDGGIPDKQIIELNSSKLGGKLENFLPTRNNISQFLISEHCENICLPDFIVKSVEQSTSQLTELFLKDKLFNGFFKSNNGKKIILDKYFIENLVGKMTQLGHKLASDIKDKNFKVFEEEFDSDEIKSLEKIVYKFETIYNKTKLENELSSNLTKRSRNKI